MVMNAALIDIDLGSFGSADPVPNYAEFDNKDQKILDGIGRNFYVTLTMQQGDSDAPYHDSAGPVRIKPMTIPFKGFVTKLRLNFHGSIPTLMALVGIRNADTGEVISKVLGPGNNAASLELQEYFDENSTLEFIGQALDVVSGGAGIYYISIMGEVQKLSRRR